MNLSNTIDAKTRICAVIGDPVEHSLSPAIHNAAFAELGLNYAYVAFHVKDVEQAIAGVRGLGLAGLSVTIPHKTAIIPHLDILDPIAENIGAVNTVVIPMDSSLPLLFGYNTDGTGALRALSSSGVHFKGARVLLIGSGGAARAIAFTLAEMTSSSLTLTDINDAQLNRLVSDLRAKTELSVEGLPANRDTYERQLPETQILIHASPVGMSPKTDAVPIDPDLLHRDLTVFDVVYNPLKTRLLQEAAAVGCKTVSGVEMFIWQAAEQFELWTGQQAPVEVMRRVVLDALGEGH